MVKWKAEGEQFFAAKATGACGLYKLAVEWISEDHWNWVVWQTEDTARDGVAGSAEAAMARAESALSELDG